MLVNTLRELAAIRSTAEDAAGRILDSAEGLLAFADKEEGDRGRGPFEQDRRSHFPVGLRSTCSTTIRLNGTC